MALFVLDKEGLPVLMLDLSKNQKAAHDELDFHDVTEIQGNYSPDIVKSADAINLCFQQGKRHLVLAWKA